MDHNRCNGTVFSAIEFLIIAALGAILAVAFAVRPSTAGALVTGGIAANALVVALYAIIAWLRGEPGAPLGQVFSMRGRIQLALDNPTLATDTVLLALATLVPLLVPLGVLFGRSRPGQQRP